MSKKNSTARVRISLNGIWHLQPTNDEAVPVVWAQTVPVPALVDLANPKYEWKKFKYHWYRTTFEVRNECDLAFVVIEHAMFGTEVWLNGRYLGGDIACYTSQEYDARKALRVGGGNELIVRVGQRENLPSHSAVGNDQERTEWIPGIWGDVYLQVAWNPRIKRLQVIPHIDSATAEVNLWVENRSGVACNATAEVHVAEKLSGTAASEEASCLIQIPPGEEHVVRLSIPIAGMKLWSPQQPFLYVLESRVLNGASVVDEARASFGMREFRIIGSDFFLNGKRVFLRGSNISFHRFLSDPDRGLLPWNLDWVKKVLMDIPKAHHFNFFRIHLGHAYNRWYDLADEYGMLLQDEWQFWGTTGTEEQIQKEFTCWLQDNWNHPSIVIWDPLNESSDPVVQNEIVPAMKKLDPTRPWESVDFHEQHPYLYSLGPTLANRKFGFAESLEVIESSKDPSVVNELLWWWMDQEFNPTPLMKDVIERWLGPQWTKEELIAQQSFLAQELVELFRRMRVDAIQPFVYLSNSDGMTGHWFIGDIQELRPKPVLAALKNALSPYGVSLELWDRHFFVGEERVVRVFIFNDEPRERAGSLRCGIRDQQGGWLFSGKQPVTVKASGCEVRTVRVRFPSEPGTYELRAELFGEDDFGPQGRNSLSNRNISEALTNPVAFSQKVAHVFVEPVVPEAVKEATIGTLLQDEEVSGFLHGKRGNCQNIESSSLMEYDLVVIGEGMVRAQAYQARLDEWTAFVGGGKSLIVLEPEYGIEESETIPLLRDVNLEVVRRADVDRGGYDSYVFATELTHPLWKGIKKEHLKMFNGAYGGEVVSQHEVGVHRSSRALARCGLGLKTLAVFEMEYGKGRVIVSRLQLRGRLIARSGGGDLYARRADPVAQQYLLNLLSYALCGVS